MRAAIATAIVLQTLALPAFADSHNVLYDCTRDKNMICGPGNDSPAASPGPGAANDSEPDGEPDGDPDPGSEPSIGPSPGDPTDATD
ncbi:hypothetical protein ACFQ14_07950 [Pseudahrensia aquimaris]|uniref:Uncharacterized protein n=1 Tax=Pseudahrensia aquimaris TaxID=744461 RepID=A0ABW3FHQ2_9HYPH